MKKRLAAIVVAAASAAAVVGGVSSALGTQHGAHCAALHARAAYWNQQADQATDPVVAARDRQRAANLEAKAQKCDERGTTTSSSTAP